MPSSRKSVRPGIRSRPDPLETVALKHLSMLIVAGMLASCASRYSEEAGAEASVKTPAQFLPGPESLEANIRFPDLPGEIDEWVLCKAVVPESGNIIHNSCFAEGENSSWFNKAIHRAIVAIQLQPAIVDGEPTQVLMHYRVLFLSDGEARDVRVFENWGYDAPRLGHDYLGPQRYSHLYFYASSCDRRVSPIVARVTLLIDAVGNPLEGTRVDFAEGSPTSSNCVRSLRRLHEMSRYIPAQLEGTPVEAAYVELWGDHTRIAVTPSG